MPLSAWWRVTVSSVLFWIVLLVAATLYAAVALAPKILEVQRLSTLYAELQWRLVQSEERADALRRVVAALDDDPQFAAEFARMDLDVSRPSEEVIAVDAALAINPRLSAHSVEATQPMDPLEPVWSVLTNDEPLRRSLLTAAAVLVITAFTFLNDGSETARAAAEGPPPSVWQRWRRRYVRTDGPRCHHSTGFTVPS